MSMLVLALLASLIIGCSEGAVTKPLTPTEVQVIAQVVSHRLILPKLPDAASRMTVIHGIQVAKEALVTMRPLEVLKNLGQYLGPENADIAALITVLIHERANLAVLPELEGKAYVFAVLDGIESGLEQGGIE